MAMSGAADSAFGIVNDFGPRLQSAKGPDEMLLISLETACALLDCTRGRARLVFPTPCEAEIGVFSASEAQEADEMLARVTANGRYEHGGIGLCVPIIYRERSCGGLLVAPPPSSGLASLSLVAQVLSDALENRNILETYTAIDDGTLKDVEFVLCLDKILDEIIDDLRLEFAAISLVDFQLHRISMVRTRNVASGWRRSVDYDLSSKDVQIHVVETKKTFTNFGEWHELFDRKTWERYVHRDLARIWCPIISSGSAIGTIEAGCYKRRADELLTEQTKDRIEEMGRIHGPAIAAFPQRRERLQALSQQTMDAVSADAALLEMYRAGEAEPWLRIPTGRASVDLRRAIGQWRSGELLPPHMRIQEIPLSEPDGECFFAVHFPQSAPLSAGRERLLQAFQRRVSILMKTAVLRDSLADTRNRAERMTSLFEVIGRASRGAPLESALQEIAQRALSVFDADTIALYQYSSRLPHGWTPLLHQYGTIRQTVPELGVSDVFPRRIFEGLQKDELFEEDAWNNPLLAGVRPGETKPRFIQREGIRSSVIMKLQTPDQEFVGLLFINYRTLRRFSEREKREIRAIANSLAITIKADRFQTVSNQSLQRKEKELNALAKLDEILLDSLPGVTVEDLCRAVLKEIASIIGAEVACILWQSPEPDKLCFRAVHGLPEPQPDLPRNRGIIGWVFDNKRSRLLHDVHREEPDLYFEFVPGMNSELVVPLRDIRDKDVVGVINLEHREKDRFAEEDRRLVELLGARLIAAVHVSNLYQQLSGQIQPRQTLGIIATMIQDPARSLDSLLRLILTGITSGEGLGFSRAMLFLMEDDDAILKGRLAIGAMNQREADDAWSALNAGRSALPRQDFDSCLTWILQRADALSASVEVGLPDCPLSATIGKIAIPLTGAEGAYGAIVRCLSQESPVNVGCDQSDWLRQRLEQAGAAARPYSYDCVRLVASGRAIGVIVVDNCFIRGSEDRKLNPEELRTLEAFAELAAMSIENRRLRQRNLIEVYRAVAHQSKTPINQAYRLLQNQSKRLSEQDLARVAALVARAARAASSFGLFANLVEEKPLRLDCQDTTVGALLGLISQLVEESRSINREGQIDLDAGSFASDRAVLLHLDMERMEYVLSNVLDNACLYALPRTAVSIAASVDNQTELEIRVTNQCPPLPAETFENATKMSWRGRNARNTHSGAGLGLWIANEFLRLQQGSFKLSQDGTGVTASIRLPLYA